MLTNCESFLDFSLALLIMLFIFFKSQDRRRVRILLYILIDPQEEKQSNDKKDHAPTNTEAGIL